jgi:hypothetical protein
MAEVAPWEQDYGDAAAVDVAGAAITNFPASAYKLGKQTYEAITSPLETADVITKLGAGLLQQVLPDELVDTIGRDQESIDLAKKVGEMYVQKYGSIEGFKSAFANDPAGIISDVGLLVGLGAASIPGKAAPVLQAGTTIPRVKRAGQITSQYTDPLGATLGVATAGGKLTAEVLGATTGVGGTPIREAFEAGAEGGKRGELFQESMRGKRDPAAVVADAMENLSQLRRRRNEQYRQSMAQGVLKDPTTLNFAGIDAALQRGFDRFSFGGKVTNQQGASAVASVKKLVDEWKAGNPGQFHTVEGFDALKQAIYEIQDTLPMEAKNARAAIGDIYNAVKSDIVKQAPDYGKVMKGYEEASQLIREIEKTLSLNPTATIDTKLRKLQSIMRNNVNTNYGQRVKLVDEIEGQPNLLKPQLAGQSLEQATPRGIQSATQPMAVASTGFFQGIPEAIGLATASSPRLVGEMAYKLGQARGLGAKLPDIPLIYTPEFRLALAEAEQAKEAVRGKAPWEL